MSHTHGATTVSQHVLQTLAEYGEPITINGLLKLIHSRHYEDEIIYRGIILTLINLGEISISIDLMLSLPLPAQMDDMSICEDGKPHETIMGSEYCLKCGGLL